MLTRFKDLHRGEPLALLANGPSILDHDLSRIPFPTMGVNKSWKLHDATYHVTLESSHWQADPDVYRAMAGKKKLFVLGDVSSTRTWARSWPWDPAPNELRVVYPGNALYFPFSTDAEKGVVEGWNGVGSVTYVALQLAHYMGFRAVYCLGLDLRGPHFHGEWAPSLMLERQNELFTQVPTSLGVRVVGSPESAAIFPKITFEEMLGAHA